MKLIKQNKLLLGVFVVLFFMISGGFVFANQTQYLIVQGLNNLAKGTFTNVQIDEKGNMTLSPKVTQLFDTKNLLVQSYVNTPTGVYLGTAQDSQIIFYNYATKKSKELYTGKGVTISALELIGSTLYFVETPTNTLYKLDTTNSDAQPIAVTHFNNVNYVWGLKFYKGQLYAITGSKAYFYSIDINAKKPTPKLIFEGKDENHFITLVINNGVALLGAEGTGGVYKVDLATKKSTTLYKTYEGEVSGILPEGNKIYFTTSAKEPKKVGTDFDYTDTFLAQQVEYQVKMAKLLDSKAAMAQALSTTDDDGDKVDDKPTMAVKNSLYVYDGQRVRKLFTRDSTSLDSLTRSPNGNLVIGASDGRVYQFNEKENKLSLLSSLTDEDVIAMYPKGQSLYALTANLGRLYEFNSTLPPKGEFISQVMDLGGLSKLGKINVESYNEQNGNVQVFIRSGQTKDVDHSWTSWQGPYVKTKELQRPNISNMRYVQYKVQIASSGGKSPEFVRLINPYTSDNKEPSISLFSVFYDRSNVNAPPYDLTLRWTAQDSDKDELTYKFYFKQKDDIQWQLLGTTTNQSKLSIDTRLLPDGIYQFKLEVTDELDNDNKGTSRVNQISNLVIVDNTPPAINIKSIQNSGANVIVKGSVVDTTGMIAKAYYKIGTKGDWLYVTPDTGIYDDKTVNFTITFPKSKLKENLENIMYIRAFDVNLNQVSHRVKLDSSGKKISG